MQLRMRSQDGHRLGSIAVRAVVCAAAGALTLGGCSDTAAPSAAPALFDIAGQWATTDLSFTFESSGDSISGVAVCNLVAACGSIVDGSPVHGTLMGSAIAVSFEMEPGTGSFTGEVASQASIPGTLTLDGVESADTLRRVTPLTSP